MLRVLRSPSACLIGLALLAAGCHGPRDGPRAIAIDAAEYDRVYDAAEAELREAGFLLERRDHRFGRVTTRPRDVPTLGEPWKPSAAHRELAAAASIAHLRRRVRVTIDPIPGETTPMDAPPAADAPRPYELAVEVVIEREQKPAQRLSGTAGRRVFAPLEALPEAWTRRGITASYWRPIDRDEPLEATLLRRIIERSLRPAREATRAPGAAASR